MLAWYLSQELEGATLACVIHRDPSNPRKPFSCHESHLCNQLDDTAGLLDLALGLLGEEARLDDDGNFGQTALAEDLGVAEREEVEDRGGVGLGAGEVLRAHLFGDERPELCETLTSGSQSACAALLAHARAAETGCGDHESSTYLVQVDNGLPEVVALSVEVSHTDLSEVTGVVFVEVGLVVVLTTGHTTTTGVLAVLANTTVTG